MKVITLRIEDELEIELNKIMRFYSENTVNKAMVKMIERHLQMDKIIDDTKKLCDSQRNRLNSIKSTYDDIEDSKARLEELIKSKLTSF